MVSTIVVRGGALACLALLLGACGKPVTITVTADVATLWDAPKQGAMAVGEERPGKVLEARRGGLFGAKGFFELRRDGKTVYLSERDAAPVPLAGVAMVVVEDVVKLDAERNHEPKDLRFGAIVQVLDDEQRRGAQQVAVLEGGVRAGSAARAGLVPMSAAGAILTKEVLEAARAGNAAKTLQRADGMAASGISLDPKVQALVAALREAEKGPPRPGPASFLRTAGPPEAGSRAYVASLSLPAYAAPDLSGAPVRLLEIDQAVEVLELGDRAAKVRPGAIGLPSKDDGAPAAPAQEVPAGEEVYVDARGLQAEPQTSLALTRQAAETKGVGERLEPLARAAAVPDAVPEALPSLFDAAMEANEPRWAAWAVQGWRFVDLVVWHAFPDAARARALAEALGPLPHALAPAMTVAAATLEAARIEGLAGSGHLVVAGACLDGEEYSEAARSLLASFHPGVAVHRVRIPLGGQTVRLRCPGFGDGGTDDWGRRVSWELVADVHVAAGKRSLRGTQFSYAMGSASDHYAGSREVMTSLFVVDGEGRVLEATQHRSPTMECGLDKDTFATLTPTLAVSGKALLVTAARVEEHCADAHRWATYRDPFRARLDPAGHIVIDTLPERRLAGGVCHPPVGE